MYELMSLSNLFSKISITWVIIAIYSSLLDIINLIPIISLNLVCSLGIRTSLFPIFFLCSFIVSYLRSYNMFIPIPKLRYHLSILITFGWWFRLKHLNKRLFPLSQHFLVINEFFHTINLNTWMIDILINVDHQLIVLTLRPHIYFRSSST